MSHGVSPWASFLSIEQIEARRAVTARIDPGFASRDRAWWDARTDAELHTIAAGAWDANEAERYQLARSLLLHRGAL